MNRREFFAVPLLLGFPKLVKADAGIYRARVMYPLDDKFRYAAVERRFSTYQEGRRWINKYRGAPRTHIDIKDLTFPENSTLREWAHRKRPPDVPVKMFDALLRMGPPHGS